MLKTSNILQGFIALLLVSCCLAVQAEQIHIAAASNLRHVMPKLAELFEQQTGNHLMISYAASGTITSQIQYGAPFDVFMSAKREYIDKLNKAGLTQGEVQHYANAQLVLFLPHHSTLDVEKGLAGIQTALENETLTKVAMANPRHAPYGQIAQQVLEEAGLWSSIQAHLLLAENASQAVQFTLSSSVDAGFIPLSYAIQPQLQSAGDFIVLKGQLPQYSVMIKGAPAAAKQFMAFMQTSLAGELLEQQGFIVKGIYP